MGHIGTGTTITFATGFFAEILDISPPGASRVSINMSHMTTTNAHAFDPGDLVDWGEMGVDLAFDPSEEPPIEDAKETVTITFPNSAASTWAFTGFMTGFEPSVPLEDRMTASATVKVDGKVTVTA